MIIKFPFLITIYLALVTVGTAAQTESYKWGERYVTYYTEDNGINIEKNQVWSIVEGMNGFMFFATNDGLIVYDGVRWELYKTNDDNIIRGLLYDRLSSRLYSCGVNEFGYWTLSANGDMNYTLLFKNNNIREHSNEFWRIVSPVGSNCIYFQSKEMICKLNPNTGKLISIQPENSFSYCYVVTNKVYAQDGNALVLINGDDSKEFVCNVEGRIVNLFVDSDGKLILAVERQGLFMLDKHNSMIPLNVLANRQLSISKIVCCERYDKDKFIVGTTLDGLFVINANGSMDNSLYDFKGLPRSSILSIATDRWGDFWLGLDSGIARIDNFKKERYIKDLDIIGSVHSVIEDQKGNILVGSNKGLFCISDNNTVRLIDGSQGPVWKIMMINNQIFVLHDQALMQYADGKLSSIRSGGILNLVQLNNDKQYFLGGDYNGISLFQIIDDKMTFITKIANFSGYSQYMQVDQYDNVWLMVPHSGFLCLTMNAMKTKFIKIKNVDIPRANSKHDILHTKIDDKLVFYNSKESYIYDYGRDSMIHDDLSSRMLNICGTNLITVQRIGNRYWYKSEHDMGYIEFVNGSMIRHNGIFESVYNKRSQDDFCALTDNVVAIGYQNGIGFCYSGQSHPTLIALRRVESVGIKSSHKYNLSERSFTVNYNMNNLRIYPLNMITGQSIDYRIVEIDTCWTTTKIYNYLSIPSITPGKYTLEIRNSGQSGSDAIKRILFKVKRPWYVSTMMIILYMVFFLMSLTIIRYYYRRKQARLKQYEHERRQTQLEKFKKDNLIKEKRISELEKERLRIENHEKDKQLAHITMNSIKRNNMLNELKTTIDEIERAEQHDKIKHATTKLLRQINSQLNSDEDWLLSEKYFNTIYDGLLDKLRIRYPILSQTDLRLCVYIKINLSTKEIAELMNITPRSVEMARYRLRKKLSLRPDDNINSILK